MIQTENRILGLFQIGQFLNDFCKKNEIEYGETELQFHTLLRKSEMENPWFVQENIFFALLGWAKLLDENNIKNWLNHYKISKMPKRVGLILAGNIPLVGFHDVICVVLSGHIPVIKLSSKDRHIIPFLLNIWKKFSNEDIAYEIVERLENFDAVIATGSNNTAKYLEYYFKNHLSIIRKNRTSIAVIKGNETESQLQLLAEDIFRYFGLGCRNVTRLFLPKNYPLDKLFENFINFGTIINHHKYANNYDYNKAVYLLNQELFWDNNFVMLREDPSLFSPLSVLNFSRYENLDEVLGFISEQQENIQAIVASPELKIPHSINFGEAQHPTLDTYADNIDTMRFLEII